MSIELIVSESDLKDLRSRLDSINIRKRDGFLMRSFQQAAVVVERKLKSNVTDRILKRRSGHLAQSIQTSVYQDGAGTVTARIGSGALNNRRMPYSEIHETGGVITPKSVKYLTIPLEAALTNSGVPKKASAREWKDTFVGRSKGGALIIFQKTGKKSIVPLYVLKRSVKIPARYYMSETLESTKNYFLMAVRGSIERSLNGEQTQ